MHASQSSPETPAAETSQQPTITRRAVLGYSVTSALLLALAFPPFNLSLLGWIAPIGWLLLVRTPVLPQRSYRIIYLSGFMFWLTVLFGVGNAHWATRLFGWPVLCGYLAFYTPLFVAISRTIVHRANVPLPIVAPIVWTALEYVRAYFATGFSMAMLGHTQVEFIGLIQVSEIVGAYGVSFVVMLSASCGAMAATGSTWHRTQSAPANWKVRLTWLATGFASVFVVSTCGVYLYGKTDVVQRLENPETFDPQDAVQIGLVQGSIDTVFGDPTQSSRTFEQYSAITDQLVKDHPNLDLVIWPETTMGDHMVFELGSDYAPPADLPIDANEHRKRIIDRSSGFQRFLKDLAVNRWQAPLLLGTSTLRYGNQRLDHFNTAIYVGPEGTIETKYDKMHPVMFGEYVPLGDYFPFVYDWLPIGGGLTPGQGPIAVDVKGVSLVPCICFENTVPQLVAAQVRELHEQGQKVDALVTLTNDGWFWGSSILDLHLTCARFRAVENGRPMLVAANTGISAQIDDSGRVVQHAPVRQNSYVIAEIFPTKRSLTLYTRYGDWFAAACLVLTIIGATIGVAIRYTRRRPPLQGGNQAQSKGDVSDV